ncbi:MAG: amidohydrolase family protein [Alphaproteobacteria bacterium]|mgnify:CR=1 FL=1|jgi:D-galactarolactone isomerase|nr:amidohydrolase family protein [Alphaproteobacteria bacterium]MDP6564025.1 amidohydrolase family protein [Alphaproteobacteria bacterium]MDP6812222.1 amidohydrolase family protein [Alphaproteobacteria bacterium]
MTEGKRPELKTPATACDTHMHFYDARFPTAPTAVFTPPDALVQDYRAIQARLGLERVVVVQPTTYGLDNACQLEALAALGDTARAVLVADATTPDVELQRLTGLGVRGIRFHMLPGGALPWELLEEMAARVHNFGWHVQLQLNGRELADRLTQLQRLPGDLVIDHVGRFMDPVPLDDPSFGALLTLLEGGRCWVKLSAPYESSVVGGPGFADVAAEARALVKAAPERMLWASNWPHPNQRIAYDEADLLDLLLDWVDDAATRDRILADNPAALYGF